MQEDKRDSNDASRGNEHVQRSHYFEFGGGGAARKKCPRPAPPTTAANIGILDLNSLGLTVSLNVLQ